MKKQILMLLIFTVFTVTVKAQNIREIPIYTLNDIACASYDNFGPVIYFNPNICQQAGQQATLFFKAHEYGHHNLGHIIQKLLNANNQYVQEWLNKNMENDADAYAVRYWVQQNDIQVIQAWVNTMWSINNMGDNTHLPSQIRATNVVQYYFEYTGYKLFP